MIKNLSHFTLGLFIVLSSCNRISEGATDQYSIELRATSAVIETDPMPHFFNQDAADDPAFWIDRNDLSNSKIIGTDKKGGLAVYNLDGDLVFYLKSGNMNNVDVRNDFKMEGHSIDIIAASNRSSHSIAVFSINPEGELTDIAEKPIISEMEGEVYGFCLYKSPVDQKMYAFINSKEGEVEQWELMGKKQKISARLVRVLNLRTQVEGMVADDEMAILYVGEEVSGIWKFQAEPDSSLIGTKIPMTDTTNPTIKFDIEGLDIYYGKNGDGYLIASIQGNYSYAIYERNGENLYLGSFRLKDGIVDGVEETDGLAVCNLPLNETFKKGIVVVQDGFNKWKFIPRPQNFKYVKWEDIAGLFDPPLEINTDTQSSE